MDLSYIITSSQSLSRRYYYFRESHYAGEVAGSMNMILLNPGATTAGKAAVLAGADPNAIVGGKKLAGAIRTKWKDPVQEKHHAERKEYFRRLMSSSKDLRAHGYEYRKGIGELE